MLSVLDFDGKNIRFEQRGDRVWASLTDMAKATGKTVGHWQSLKSTSEFLVEFESIVGIAIIESRVGGAGIPEQERGTWAIEEVAIDFATWCNVGFRIWVAQQIKSLVNAAKIEMQPPAIALPPSDVRVCNLTASLQSLGIELTNPRFKQELQDLALDILGVGQPRLSGSEPKETWLGVAERAEQLGYPIALVTRNRSPLGKYVKACGLESKSEERLCNGTQRPINLYLKSKQLDDAIAEFLDAKILSTTTAR